MSEVTEKCLDTFPNWLKSLNSDVDLLLKTLNDNSLSPDAKRSLIGGINYLFKSLDLIPDGIDDIGFLDDAFILRLATKFAAAEGLGDLDAQRKSNLDALIDDCGLIEAFLETELFDRFSRYAQKLSNGAARGRTVDELTEDPEVYSEFSSDARAFVNDYTPPNFARDPKNLIKLKAFFDAKLPK